MILIFAAFIVFFVYTVLIALEEINIVYTMLISLGAINRKQ
jgi:hypothetical protein